MFFWIFDLLAPDGNQGFTVTHFGSRMRKDQRDKTKDVKRRKRNPSGIVQ